MKRVLSYVFLAVATSVVQAQGAADIVVGASLPLSGPNAAAGHEGLAVAHAYFDMVNKAGGIDGRRMMLKTLDDAFDPQKAAENARSLAEDKTVVAIFNCWGTASCSAMMPIITEREIPLITGIAGGGKMRTTPGKFAFNLRASTESEIARMIGQMAVVGQTKLAVVYQRDSFGQSALASAQGIFANKGIQPAGEYALEPDGNNAAMIVDSLGTAGVQGIILLASPVSTVALIKLARKSGVSVPFYNLAAQANAKVAADLAGHINGVIFATLVPSPWRATIPVVREYQTAYTAATGKTDYSYLGLEVFINAKLLVDGLRQAGRSVTRSSLVTALETMDSKLYSDQMQIKYGPRLRSGSGYVGLTIISQSGRFVE
ncbi:ABC transporter substrate-binding protein [Variovorax boronicumulans]|uniref:ABC transporter substrate-binding protein n=1 Tax=Variovorax boronicumulans TaxID=436515 RepID=UPI0012E50B5B|nr:ABC transporter substrate-binding protein [Variovorax boronicumulans]GER21226.1 ABC transporter permease [Variovorax boronicumulans]